MFRWIAKSRLRVGVAMICFILLPFVTIVLVTVAFEAGAVPRAPPAEDAIGIRAPSAPEVISVITAIVGATGTISTLILAWRTDRRNARESELKTIQMQQQILEMQAKLKAAEAAQHPSASAQGF